MLAFNPPLAALHSSRLDHASAVAYGLINAAEHFAAASLRLQNQVLDRVAERLRAPEPLPPAMLAIELGSDPEVQRMGAAVFQEQMHLAADVGTRWIAYGEWHRQGMNRLLGHWLARVEASLPPLPPFAGVEAPPQVVAADGAAAADTTVAAELASGASAATAARSRNRRQ